MLFDILNAIALTTFALAPPISVMSSIDMGPLPKTLNAAPWKVQLHRSVRTEDGANNCQFYGYMIPYAITWDEKREDNAGHEYVIAATPNKLEAFGVVVTRKECPGKQAEMVWWAGSYGTFIPNFKVGNGLDVEELLQKKPLWLPQFMTRIEQIAKEGDASAKTFLEEYHTAEADAIKRAEEAKKAELKRETAK